METNRLRQFKVIVDAGGLIKASEILGISGGGLSKSMDTLEREIGHELFNQRGRGLELTESGRKLYDNLPSILKVIDAVISKPETKLKSETEILKIATFEVFSTYFLSSIMAKSPFSKFGMEIREAAPGQMEPLIAEGVSEFGITYLPIPHAGVEFLKVGRVQMGVFGLKSVFDSKNLRETPFAVPMTPLTGTPSGVRGLDGWPDHLFERQALFKVEMMESALQLCRQGRCVAFLPEFVVGLANKQAALQFQLAELSLPNGIKPVFRDVFIIQKKGAKETKHIREIAKAIRNLS